MSRAKPLSVEKQVAALTDESLRESSIGANLDFVDAIQRSSDDGKEALKYLMKRLKHKSPHVQMLTLTLLDLCVKNTTYSFHQLLGCKDYLKLLSEIATDRKMATGVRDYILTLIETWNEAFAQTIPIFGEYYRKLKQNELVEFPARDLTALAPVATPLPNQAIFNGVNVQAQQQQADRRGGAMPHNPYENQQQYGVGAAQQPPGYRSAGDQSGGYYSGPPVLGVLGSPPPSMLAGGMQQQHLQQQQQQGGGGGYPPQQPQSQHMHVPMAIANPAYGQPMYMQPMQPQPMMQQQPPQQQQQPAHRGRSASQVAAYRAQLSPAQLKLFEQCNYLSQAYLDKVKRETRLTFEYLSLLRDLCTASEGPRQLQADALATNLAGTLMEVRNRYTKLILEVGDVSAPAAAPAVEFITDLSIRMIEVIRLLLDYHKLKCDGVQGLKPPEIVMPRSMNEEQRYQPQQQQPQQRQQQQFQQSSPQQQPSQPQQQQPSPAFKVAPAFADDAAGAGSAPRTMQLFDLPPPSNEEDEKRTVANVFASSHARRSKQPAPEAFSEPGGSDGNNSGGGGGGGSGRSPQPQQPKPTPLPPSFVSSDNFSPAASSFAPAQPFGSPSESSSRYALPAAADGITAVTSPSSRYALPAASITTPSQSSSKYALPAAAAGATAVTSPSSKYALQPDAVHTVRYGGDGGSNASYVSPESFQPSSSFAPPSAAAAESKEAEHNNHEATPFEDEAPAPTPVDRSFAGKPHRTRQQEEDERAQRQHNAQQQAQQQEDAARAFDLLAPMRSFGAVIPNQSGLRKTSMAPAPIPEPVADEPESPGAVALSPGGPSFDQQEHAAAAAPAPAAAASNVASSVDDDFLNELMGLTIPQKAPDQ